VDCADHMAGPLVEMTALVRLRERAARLPPAGAEPAVHAGESSPCRRQRLGQEHAARPARFGAPTHRGRQRFFFRCATAEARKRTSWPWWRSGREGSARADPASAWVTCCRPAGSCLPQRARQPRAAPADERLGRGRRGVAAARAHGHRDHSTAGPTACPAARRQRVAVLRALLHRPARAGRDHPPQSTVSRPRHRRRLPCRCAALRDGDRHGQPRPRPRSRTVADTTYRCTARRGHARPRRGGVERGMSARFARVVPGLARRRTCGHEWILTLCLVIAIAAVRRPAADPAGTQARTVATLRDRLVQDPVFREIRPLADPASMRPLARPHGREPAVGFLLRPPAGPRSIIGAVHRRRAGCRPST